MIKYLVFDKSDITSYSVGHLLERSTYIVEAPNPETAALIYVEEWGDQHSYDTQETDYYVFVVDYNMAKAWFNTLPDNTTEKFILQMATGYRGYRTWVVEEGIDEMDPDLVDEEEDDAEKS